ncbi:zf-HC2 domain-containing protein [candidate division WOR-3 bacterium]|nr:zf-HC2 domain-containing protein [candidate division WOR-3 bacterium]
MSENECQKVRGLLAVFLADGMDDAQKASIRRHLGTCESCRKALAAETRLNRVLRQAIRPRVNPSYWERTWPRIQVALVARRQRRRGRVLRWVLSGAGALAAAALLFMTTHLPPFSVTRLSTHDASFFTKLPTDPPTLQEVLGTSQESEASTELAILSMGHASPSERVIHWENLEGF